MGRKKVVKKKPKKNTKKKAVKKSVKKVVKKPKKKSAKKKTSKLKNGNKIFKVVLQEKARCIYTVEAFIEAKDLKEAQLDVQRKQYSVSEESHPEIIEVVKSKVMSIEPSSLEEMDGTLKPKKKSKPKKPKKKSARRIEAEQEELERNAIPEGAIKITNPDHPNSVAYIT